MLTKKDTRFALPNGQGPLQWREPEETDFVSEIVLTLKSRFPITSLESVLAKHVF